MSPGAGLARFGPGHIRAIFHIPGLRKPRAVSGLMPFLAAGYAHFRARRSGSRASLPTRLGPHRAE